MAITIQYASDLDSIVTARTTGAHKKFAPGNHRGVVRHSSGIVTLASDLDHVSGNVGAASADYDILGFMEFTPNIRLLNVLLKMSGAIDNSCTLDLITYDPTDITDPEKHVSVVAGITPVAVAGADTAAAVLAQQQAQWPFMTDNYKTKLIQGAAGVGELDITASIPLADGSNAVNHGSFGLGIAAASGASDALQAADIVELSVLYVYE